MKLFYTDRSIEDIDTAFAWYEKQRRGLGFDFLDCIDAALRNIHEFPLMCPVKYKNFRACVIRRFPYLIYYTIEDDTILVLSVFDSRQNPNKLP